MAEVAQPVVDRRGGEHEERLRPHRIVKKVVKTVVTRRLDKLVPVPPAPGIAEMVGFVDDHDIGKLRDATEPLGEFPLAAEVRMAEDRKIAEIRITADTPDMRQPL